MNHSIDIKVRLAMTAAFISSISFFGHTATAQDGRPAPERPVIQAGDNRDATTGSNADTPTQGDPIRRELPEGKITLGFKNVKVPDLIEWIATQTGKFVIPVRANTLGSIEITLIADEPIERSEAIDLVFTTLRLNNVGIIETDRFIIIISLDDAGFIPDIPVLKAETDIMSRTDFGSIVIKIFPVVNRSADGIFEQIDETKPPHVTISVDIDSNQLVVHGDIGYCQRVQRIINELDKKWVIGETRTYRLSHADAQEIADNILELFETSATSSIRPGNRTSQGGRRQPTRPGVRPGGQNTISPSTAGPVVEMRVTVNAQQNTVTINAESSTLDKIAKLIDEVWDLPRPDSTSTIYLLKHSDPIKVRDTLRELLGTGGGGGGGAVRPGQAPGGGGGAAPELGNIYRIEAYSDLNAIIVIGKTEASFKFLDNLIKKLDQASEFGLPIYVELNHADAVDISEMLNALLQEEGAGASFQVPGEGLSGQGLGSGEGGGTVSAPVGREAQDARDANLPWANGRANDSQSPISPLIGKIRIMPIVRQNALSIVCPAQYREQILNMVKDFDRPGRQVMISAIIAEVDLTEDLALGLRVSSAGLSLTNIDNALTATVGGVGQELNVLTNLFDTSTLDVNFSANLAIQALAQMTNVRILQEPRVFTADNQEAYFFDGQDVPFINNSNTTDTGGITQSFEYTPVGVILNVRPRITAQGNVDMEVYLELSSIVPGQTLFGGFIIDRRSTTTQITVKNGQTIVLSGILRDSESTITRKVPFLGDIPLIGAFFTSRENAKSTSELIAFITPVVVDTPGANDELNAPDLRQLERMSHSIKDQDHNPENVRSRIIEAPIVPEPINTFDDPSQSRQPRQPRDLRDDTKGRGR